MKKIAAIFNTAFAPLLNKNLSMYLSGQAVSLMGSAMQSTAQAWVVWQLSHSAKALGIVTMLSFAPLLVLGSIGGVWADRLDRRKLLIAIQAVAAVLAFIFAILVQTGLIRIWHIYLLAVILGSITAIDMPAQMALIGDITETVQVREAIALNNMIRQASRTIGPALAGLVIGAMGVPSAFWINGASFLTVIGSLMTIHSNQEKHSAHSQSNGQLKEVWQFLAQQPRLQDLLLISACVPFFAFSIAGLLPAIVTDFLHKGPQTLGLLEGASGAGALLSSLILVPIAQHIRHAGRVVTITLIWAGICFSTAAYSQLVPIWVAAMFLGSAIIPVVMTTSTGLLQMTAPPEMKARLMGVWMMLSFGTQPFGAILIGYAGQFIGVREAIVIYGSAMFVIGVALLLFRKGLRDWEPQVVHQS